MAAPLALRDDQREGVERVRKMLADEGGGILADDMGLGKTLQAIHIADGYGRVLFVVPASVLEQWQLAIRHNLPGLDHPPQATRTLKEDRMTPLDAISAFMRGSQWLVITYGYYVRNADVFTRFAGATCQRINLLVCDEAHALCNSRSRRHELVAACPAEKRLLLTATPCANDLGMFYSLADLACPGALGDSELFSKLIIEPLRRGSLKGAARWEICLANDAHRKLKAVRDRFVVRREKTAQQRGLPPRFDYVVACKASKLQYILAEHLPRDNQHNFTGE